MNIVIETPKYIGTYGLLRRLITEELGRVISSTLFVTEVDLERNEEIENTYETERVLRDSYDIDSLAVIYYGDRNLCRNKDKFLNMLNDNSVDVIVVTTSIKELLDDIPDCSSKFSKMYLTGDDLNGKLTLVRLCKVLNLETRENELYELERLNQYARALYKVFEYSRKKGFTIGPTMNGIKLTKGKIEATLKLHYLFVISFKDQELSTKFIDDKGLFDKYEELMVSRDKLYIESLTYRDTINGMIEELIDFMEENC